MCIDELFAFAQRDFSQSFIRKADKGDAKKDVYQRLAPLDAFFSKPLEKIEISG